MASAPPRADREPVVDVLHGHRVADPYRWLEDPTSTATQRWLAAQHDLWCEHVAGLPGREGLHARVAELSAVGVVTAPAWRGGRRFVLRQCSGQEHAVLHTAGPTGPEAAVLDPTALDPSGGAVLDAFQPDWEGRRLAYQLSRGGDERSELFVLDVATGQVVDGPIDRCRYSPVAWLPGGEAFYYVRATADGGRRRVLLHRVGTPDADDIAVLDDAEAHPATSYGLAISPDGRWLTISASRVGAPGNDLWLADLAGTGPARPRLRAVQVGVPHRTVAAVGPDGRLYVVTDQDAPRGRLCLADPARPAEGWHDLLPADPETVLAEVAVLDGPELSRPLLLARRTRHATGEITVHDLGTGRRLGEVPLPGAGSLGSLSVRVGWPSGGGHEAWFTYTDAVTPPAVHRYDARTGTTTLWEAAPGSVELPDVDSRQVVATSADGTPVPALVLAARDRPAGSDGGPRPTVLYGYGGFGVPLVPTYSSFALAWVEAGGVFATALLRGGGEDGEDWHRAGAREHKQNVFDDAVAVAETLVAQGWTSPDRLGICGESNGGLMAGVALTQRPELFAAAVCSAPLLDMVRYERFGMGAAWTGEFGSAADPDQLRWLLGYSPYHRVRAGVDYPAVLFTTFGGDTRVDPLHARKMCAALQWASGSGRPVLIRHEDGVGHGAQSAGRATALAADMLAFLAAHTGLEPARIAVTTGALR